MHNAAGGDARSLVCLPRQAPHHNDCFSPLILCPPRGRLRPRAGARPRRLATAAGASAPAAQPDSDDPSYSPSVIGNAIHLAARSGNERVLEMLLPHAPTGGFREGIASWTSEGDTPLHLAAQHVGCTHGEEQRALPVG